MNVQELRIGNLVKFGIINTVRVKSINPQTFICEASNSLSGKDEFHDMISFQGDTASGNSRIEAFIPIPLTEEILLKCGFKKQKLNTDGYLINWFTIGEFEIYQKNNHYVLSNYECNIQYLHELQNLYFALVGEELEINL